MPKQQPPLRHPAILSVRDPEGKLLAEPLTVYAVPIAAWRFAIDAPVCVPICRAGWAAQYDVDLLAVDGRLVPTRPDPGAIVWVRPGDTLAVHSITWDVTECMPVPCRRSWWRRLLGS